MGLSTTQKHRDLGLTTSALIKNVKINTAKLYVHKKVLQEVCQEFIGAEEFVRDKIEEICCNEKLLSVEEVNLFCLWMIATTFRAKLVIFAINVLKKQQVLLNL